MTGFQEMLRARYDDYAHHTLSFNILVNNEGQERERSFDVWASRAEIEEMVRDGYLVREALIQGAELERLRCALDEVEAAEFAVADGSRLQGKDWIPRHLFDRHADFHDLINFEPVLSVARAVLGPFVRVRQLAARISYPGQPVQFTRWHHHQPGMTDPLPGFFRVSAQAGLSHLSGRAERRQWTVGSGARHPPARR